MAEVMTTPDLAEKTAAVPARQPRSLMQRPWRGNAGACNGVSGSAGLGRAFQGNAVSGKEHGDGGRIEGLDPQAQMIEIALLALNEDVQDRAGTRMTSRRSNCLRDGLAFEWRAS
jgi:hypothetical protein